MTKFMQGKISIGEVLPAAVKVGGNGYPKRRVLKALAFQKDSKKMLIMSFEITSLIACIPGIDL